MRVQIKGIKARQWRSALTQRALCTLKLSQWPAWYYVTDTGVHRYFPAQGKPIFRRWNVR